MNGMQNDLPVATREALDSMKIKFPGPKGEDSRGNPDVLLSRIEALEIKFRTLQTRCNSVLAMQAQIYALLNELKIQMRGKTQEPKNIRGKK